jgi:hypothetical protein
VGESPGAFIKHLIPMVRKIRLETIEQDKRHSTLLARDYFDLAINRELRVDSI